VPGGWRGKRVVAITGGGIAGAALRWAVVATGPAAGQFPWRVLAVNVAGSLLLGVILAEE